MLIEALLVVHLEVPGDPSVTRLNLTRGVWRQVQQLCVLQHDSMVGQVSGLDMGTEVVDVMP